MPLGGRNPNWSRDEIVLALDCYTQHNGNPPGKASAEVAELSALINALNQTNGIAGNETFRNPDGVYMKMMNFRQFDPNIESSGLSGASKLDEATWQEFEGRSAELRAEASLIRKLIRDNKTGPVPDLDLQISSSVDESGIVARTHLARERSSKIVREKKRAVLQTVGSLKCEACSFDFGKAFGERGEGYIECHHTKPVSDLTPGERTKLSDLALVCSNCHRMIHRRKPMLSIEELKALLDSRNECDGT